MHRIIATVATLVLVLGLVAPANAGDPPLPTFPTGDLWSRQSHIHTRYDVTTTPPDVVSWCCRHWRFPWGSDLAVDEDAYLYMPGGMAGFGRGLFIIDSDEETWVDGPGYAYPVPVGFASLPEGEGLESVTLRSVDGQRQAFGMDTYRRYLYVFDVTDVTNPTLLTSHDLRALGYTWTTNRITVLGPNGGLWTGSDQTLHRFTLAANGDISGYESWRLPGVGPAYMAFDGPDRLFVTHQNRDRITVRDATDPTVELATIQDVCGNWTHNPGDVAFASNGDLYVSCNGAPDGADIVRFSAGALAGLTGTNSAATLDPLRFSGPEIGGGGGFLAFLPAEDPVSLIGGVIDDIGDLGLDAGLTNALMVKLESALATLDDGDLANDHAAVNKLEAFIAQVEAQSGKKIDVEVAAVLIDRVAAIIELLTM